MPAFGFKLALVAGIAAAAVIAGVLHIGDVFGVPMMVASFGATAVLLFATPTSPVSQPVNIIAGHFVAALVGLSLVAILPDNYFLAGLSVGVSITVMMVLGIVNPPAGATGLVTYLSNPGWWFLIFPVLCRSVVLVAFATMFLRLRGIEYPIEPK